MSTDTGVTYTIGGVKVNFPAKAYPSQVSMMDKIIRGCSRAQNCLLESPTGSGKTLALLCGAIAWQKAEKQRLSQEHAAARLEYERKNKEMEMQQLQSLEAIQKAVCGDGKNLDSAMEVSDASAVEVIEVFDISDSEDGDIFRGPITKKSKKEEIDLTNKGSKPNQSTSAKSKNEIVDKNSKSDVVEKNPPPKAVKPPTIYFCTRTHKQITQVVKELRRTAYHDIRSTILSSRNHSCIHEKGADPRVNRTELCHQLIDPKRGLSCRFQRNVRNYCSFDVLQNYSFSPLWDLEDMITFGKKRTVCPYYTARELMKGADIIFCPYNYLIDPLIRNSMKITLNGDIVIVDEAHNIEDSCREAASFTLIQDSVTDSIHELEELMKNFKNDPKEDCCANLINVLCSLSSWIDEHRDCITALSDYDQGNYTMLGAQAVDSFKEYAFGPEKFESFKYNYAALTTEDKPQNVEDALTEDSEDATITGTTKGILEGLLLVLSLLYDPRYTHDYHVVLTKTFCHQHNENPEPDNAGWYNVRKRSKTVSKWRHTLNFWCFNPAASFFTIEENARCIVLSSGTLSPMNSFQSELGSTFPITLEANHVIDPSQCWIASVGRGPNNVSLDGKFANTSTYQFQDEIGTILLRICSFVPHGVLCFVPSYSLLEKLYERWSCTNALDEIKKHKLVLCEPRKGDELDSLLKTFYETIEDTAENEVGRDLNGVLLLAVCRGKVSEGLDFADNNARVVVTIGIPYPSIKDKQVMLKKSYNDKNRLSKGLLSGQEWYEIQAYRALNQALGRCIRHRKDWGGILLIDNRFTNKNYYRSLSKWVRNKVSHCHNYCEMIDSLSTFIENRLKIDKESG